MRIFLAIPGSPNSAFASSLWRANLHDPLVEMGHDVVLFERGVQPLFDLDPEAPETRPFRAEFSETLVRAVDEAHASRPLDLVITYLSDSHLDPPTAEHLGTRAPVLNFFCNNVHQFHLVKRTAPHYTACLVPERTALAAYERVGATPIFFPMAANPDTYRRYDLAVAHDVSFAGQRYADRASAILALREERLDAHAYGQGWEADPAAQTAAGDGAFRSLGRLARQVLTGRSVWRAWRDRANLGVLRRRHADALHGPLSDDAYVRLFSRSRVNLGFLILGDTHRTSRPLRQVRLREFEGPMAGAFYMTEWLEELAEHYEIGTEIVCFRSHEEMVDLCRHYLLHEEERERIRRAGHARARRDHTWARRFETLFGELRRRDLLR